MALEQAITDLTQAANGLTAEVAGKMAAIDAKVAQAQIDFNALTPEKRIVTDFTIGGDANYLYPVWWRHSGNAAGVTKLTIARGYRENAADAVGGLLGRQNHIHAYGLLLEMEGNAYSWSGDAMFLQIKRFVESYDVGASHVQHAMACDPALSLSAACSAYSGCYLRGGGLTYHVICNQDMPIHFQDGSLGTGGITEIYNNGNYHWSVKPIPLASIQTPVADVYPYSLIA